MPKLISESLLKNKLAGISFLFFFIFSPGQSQVNALTFTELQKKTYEELLQNLEKRHYSKLVYNQELSSSHLTRYIDKLDPGRLYFDKTDIENFIFDSETPSDIHNDLEDSPSIEIFNLFKKRLNNRVEELLRVLPYYASDIDYTIDEYLDTSLDTRDWAENDEALNDYWRKYLKNQVLNLKLTDKNLPEIVDLLTKRYVRQLKTIEQYTSMDVFDLYANALTELHDPHTKYMSPRSSENFNINMSLSLEGIGALLTQEDEYTKVQRLITAGPAEKQGELQPSDRIVGVGQDQLGPVDDVIGWRLDDVVQLIRGPKGTTVRLEVIPANKSADSRRIISIVRNKVKLEEQSAGSSIINIRSRDREVKIGVIELPTFYIDFAGLRSGDPNYRSTTRDVEKLLLDLRDEDIDGLVIDLRDNGGGSLQEANELTGLFIEYGPTVQIKHSSKRIWRDGKREKTSFYDGPLLVMINRLSASASEIFSGAIQDYGRGIIVGERSFGKGTVQTLLPLTSGQLKITESKFYRISGASTQNKGVLPDIIFPSIYNSEEIGESALDYALAWDQINPVRHRIYRNLSEIIPYLSNRSLERTKVDPDFTSLRERVMFSDQNRENTKVSLNESERKLRRLEREDRALEIENKRRQNKGLERIDSIDQLDEPVTVGDKGSELSDFILQEAGNILTDLINLLDQVPIETTSAKFMHNINSI